jgi:hypothetical protein
MKEGMEVFMENLKINSCNINERKGLAITFTSNDNVIIKSKFGLIHNEVEHYFEVIEISATPHNPLQIKAIEIGYYHMFHKSKEDIRNILGLDVFLITDAEKIKQVSQESHYC